MAEEQAAGRDQKIKKVFQDAFGLIVRHDPDAHSGQQAVRWRREYGACGSRLDGDSRIPSGRQTVSERLPAGSQVGIGINDHAQGFNVALFQPDRQVF